MLKFALGLQGWNARTGSFPIKYCSAMTERPRELGDFNGVGHFEAKS